MATFEDLRRWVLMESDLPPISSTKLLCNHSKLHVAHAKLKVEVNN
jgi:hypothetical protein